MKILIHSVYQDRKLLIKSLHCFCLCGISHNVLLAKPAFSHNNTSLLYYIYLLQSPEIYNHTTTMSCMAFIRFVIFVLRMLEKHR